MSSMRRSRPPTVKAVSSGRTTKARPGSGGTQDNFSWCGPSRTKNINGIMNSDWYVTTGGDGFRSQVDPEDPNTVYSEAQYGALVRYDKRTGEELFIQPSDGKGEPPLRWNWDSPLIVSPHAHTRLYFGANR